MSFLTPWFLLGALAVAGPIFFHLIRRAARQRLRFSSLMFLRPTPPRTVRRRKLEHPALLLLRCLGLLLIATGFARPFLPARQPPAEAAGGGNQLILLVDTSASMKRNGVWEKARGVAERYLQNAAPEDQVDVMTFDHQVRSLVSFGEWTAWAADERAALARQRLAAIAPGWMGTQLGLALTRAAEQFRPKLDAAAPPKSRTVVLISDLQEGAKLDGLQGHEWPANVRVVIERVAGRQESNAGLEILGPPDGSAGSGNDVRVRVANSSDSSKEKFRLQWSGVHGPAAEIYLPPGQSRTFAAPALPAGATTASLELSGDDVAFDNVSYFAAPETENVTVACLGLGSASEPAGLLYYLERVFPPTPRRIVELASAEALPRAAFAVVSGELTPEECTAVHDWLAGGKSALLLLNDVESARTLAALLGLPRVQLTEASGDFALLGQIDFQHPIFAPFADPRFSDFSRIHFWKHRCWAIPASLPASVLAKFDDGSPALTQAAVGKGRLLVLASGWNPSDSQLAVSSKFPPLLQTLLEWSGSTAPARFQFQTGDAIPSPVASGLAVQWQRPDGKTSLLPAGTPYVATDRPGIYHATWPGGHRQFAVNLPVAESRIAPMPADELARLGVPLGPAPEAVAAPAQVQARQLQRADLENRQKIWRQLLLAALATMLVEIILSGWLARRAAAPQEAS
jgi:hypothetical protein